MAPSRTAITLLLFALSGCKGPAAPSARRPEVMQETAPSEPSDAHGPLDQLPVSALRAPDWRYHSAWWRELVFALEPLARNPVRWRASLEELLVHPGASSEERAAAQLLLIGGDTGSEWIAYPPGPRPSLPTRRRALGLLGSAASRGDVPSMLLLADCLRRGMLLDRPFDGSVFHLEDEEAAPQVVLAQYWFERAAQAGSPWGALELGLLLHHSGREQEVETWLVDAANAGHGLAAYILACSLDGSGPRKPGDSEQSRLIEVAHWLRIAIRGASESVVAMAREDLARLLDRNPSLRIASDEM